MPKVFDPPYPPDYRDLPRLARVALNARFGQRIASILPWAHPNASKATVELVERAVAALEAGGTGAEIHDFQAVLEASINTSNHSHARGVFLSLAKAWQKDGPADSIVALEVCRLAPYRTPWRERFQASDDVHIAVWKDLERLREYVKRHGLTDDSPVGPDVFGELWPDGTPKWFEALRPNWKPPAGGFGVVLDGPAKEVPPDRRLRPDLFRALTGLRAHDVKVEMLPPGNTADLHAALAGAPQEGALRDIADLWLLHDGAALDWRHRELHGHSAVVLLPVACWPSAADDMFGWDNTRALFEPRVAEELHMELAPYSREDVLVFAKLDMSPDCWFTVRRGPLAGKVLKFEHELGSGMTEPWCEGFLEFLERVPDDL